MSSTATSAEKQAYLDEVKAAQEEAMAQNVEPVSNEITESEWELMNTRRSQGDADLLFDIVVEHGGVSIVPDPEPPPEEVIEEPPPEEPAPEQRSSKKS